MGTKVYSIKFKGYCREKKKSGMPKKFGLFCVYSCVYDKEIRNVSIGRLLYIGHSYDVYDTIHEPELHQSWKNHLMPEEELCYSYAAVPATVLSHCAASLIYRHKPPENNEYVHAFPFDKTTLKLSGKISKLNDVFTVSRT